MLAAFYSYSCLSKETTPLHSICGCRRRLRSANKKLSAECEFCRNKKLQACEPIAYISPSNPYTSSTRKQKTLLISPRQWQIKNVFPLQNARIRLSSKRRTRTSFLFTYCDLTRTLQIANIRQRHISHPLDTRLKGMNRIEFRHLIV